MVFVGVRGKNGEKIGTLVGILYTCFHVLLILPAWEGNPRGAEETDSRVTAHCHTGHRSFRIRVRWDRFRDSQVVTYGLAKGNE